jgi:Leucine-rich repeat (LRR) protein
VRSYSPIEGAISDETEIQPPLQFCDTALAAALNVNKALRILDLSHNNLGSKGDRAVADALMINLTLETLNLSQTMIESIDCTTFAENLGLDVDPRDLQFK